MWFQVIFLILLSYFSSGQTWVQTGPKLVGDLAIGDHVCQGASLALDSSGTLLIFGGDYDSNGQGAFWTFNDTMNNGTFTQQYLKAVPIESSYYAAVGRSAGISADGKILAVSGPNEAHWLGATWIFTSNTSSLTGWTHVAMLLGTGASKHTLDTGPNIGRSLALNKAGNILVVGGPNDDTSLGAVWTFASLNGNPWKQQGSKLLGTDYNASFYANVLIGCAVALNNDGNVLAVGGSMDGWMLGAVWMFNADLTTNTTIKWIQQGPKLVPRDAAGSSFFGSSVSLNGVGNILAVGGPSDGYDYSLVGATFIFQNIGGVWSQVGSKLIGSGGVGTSKQGGSVSLNKAGDLLAVGGADDNGATGAVWVFAYDPQRQSWYQVQDKLIGSGVVNINQRRGTTVLVSDAGDKIIFGGIFDGRTGSVWAYGKGQNGYVEMH